MLLGFNGATTMKATLPEDIVAAGKAGFKALEIWAAKMDTYLANRSLDDLNAIFTEHRLQPVSINSIEFITFRSADDYALIKARCHELCARAYALGCDKIVVVPSPTPEGGASWEEIKAESVRVLHDWLTSPLHTGCNWPTSSWALAGAQCVPWPSVGRSCRRSTGPTSAWS